MRSLIAIYLIVLNLFPLLCYNQNDSLSKNQTLASLDHYQNLLSTEIKNENLSGMADAYYEIGALYEKLYDYNNAITNTQKAVELYSKLGNADYTADAYLNLGNIYYQLRLSEKVISSYKSALDLLKQKRNPSVGRIYMNIGNEYYNQKIYEIAIQYYIKGLPLLDKDDLKARGFNQVAISYQYLSKYDDAINYYLESVSFWDKVGKENKIAESFCFIANMYHEKGDYEKSNDYNLKVISICEKIGIQNTMTMAQAYNGLGQNYHSMGNYEQANYYHLKSLIISITKGDSRGEAAAYTNLGNVYFRVGNYLKALEYHQRSIKIKDSVGLKKELSISYNNIGLIYHNIGNFTKAIEYFENSMEIEKANGDSASLCGTFINIGGAYADKGEKNKAMEFYFKSIEISKSKGQKKDMAAAYTNLANVYNSKGDYKLALEHINKSIAICENINALSYAAGSYNARGEIYFNQKLFLEATESSKKSFELYKKLGEKKGMLNSINDIVTADLANNNFKEALEYSMLSMEMIKKSIYENIVFMNENERDKFWSDKEYYFNNVILNLVKTFNTSYPTSELGYNCSVMTKSFLMDATRGFNTAVNYSKDSLLIKLYEHLKALRKYNAKLTSEGSKNSELISRLEHQADSLDQLLSRKMSAYAKYKENFFLTWKDVQANLSSDEAAIEFASYHDDKDSAYHYLALIVKLGDKYPQLVKLCTENELKQYSQETELNTIYDLIWRPLLPSLTNVKTIYYSPVGLLNNIPFQALYKEENGQREYVMDKFTLHQLTSSRYLALDLKKKEQETIEPSIALFGGINYNDYPNAKIDTTIHNESTEAAFLYKNAIVLNRELDSTRTGANYLPGTKKEVETIADVLKLNQWQVDVSEGKNATENKIKSLSGNNSKSILHIATHGFAFPNKEEKRKDMAFSMMRGNDKYKTSDNPMIRSGLLFGGANLTWQGKGDSLLNTTNEDGVLTAYELSQLDLTNIKLAVLSACETGKGAIQGSEGTFGLKRALKLAGVDNMIVSLWKVPDDATMEMMTLFYTELANTKKPVSSFEIAQKAMRVKYPNEAKKWAGFVFVR
jgi:tetratricopeptide (TPR) repeat protein/CHAT domain-containing protein